ncbi:DUF2207 domain-containing protein [Clostridium sp. DL1XJH146]
MKKLQVTMVLIMVLGLLSFISPEISADEYFDIRDYDVYINVLPNNNYEITETISVEFYENRHGIYRDIDREYNGLRHAITDVKVTDGSGNELEADVSSKKDLYRIQIGEKKEYVSGLQTYKISYVYAGNDDIYDSYDEFYFNIIGTQWDVFIDQARFTIEMPKGFDPEQLNITTGYLGNTSNEHANYTLEGNMIHVETYKQLWPNEGITIALTLPQGYYEDSEPWISQNLVLILFGIMGMIFCRILVFFFMKNNKKKIKPVLVDQPPEGLNCAELAYIYKGESIQYEDISSLILQWATEGYLEIHENTKGSLIKKEAQFVKIKDIGNEKQAYEQQLFKDLFAHGNGDKVYKSQLRMSFHENLYTAQQAIEQRFSGDKDILADDVQGNVIIGFIGMMLLFTVMTIMIGLNLFEIGFWSAAGLSLLIMIGFTIGGIVILLIFRQKRQPMELITGSMFILVMIGIAVILIIRNWSYISLLWKCYPVVFLLLLGIVVLYEVGLVILGSVKHYTPYGIEMMGQIMGFKIYIDEAHAEDINNRNLRDSSYIYSLLPFAMVLGLSKEWNKLLNYVTVMDRRSPFWYFGYKRFDTDEFTSNMRGTMSSISSTPSSNSNSSGGYSGGGGGGGGGGSW